MGIKWRNIPDLLAPITEIPFIQKRNESNPGNITTYAKVKKNGLSNIICYQLIFFKLDILIPKIINIAPIRW